MSTTATSPAAHATQRRPRSRIGRGLLPRLLRLLRNGAKAAVQPEGFRAVRCTIEPGARLLVGALRIELASDDQLILAIGTDRDLGVVLTRHGPRQYGAQVYVQGGRLVRLEPAEAAPPADTILLDPEPSRFMPEEAASASAKSQTRHSLGGGGAPADAKGRPPLCIFGPGGAYRHGWTPGD